MDKTINFIPESWHTATKRSPYPSCILCLLIALAASFVVPMFVPARETIAKMPIQPTVVLDPKSFLVPLQDRYHGLLNFYSHWHPWHKVLSKLLSAIDGHGQLDGISYNESLSKFEFSGVVHDLRVVTDLILELSDFEFLQDADPYKTEKVGDSKQYNFSIRYRVAPLATRVSESEKP